MEADGRLCGRREKQRKGRRTVSVVKLHCDVLQKPSAEGQMRVGRTVLSKDMMEVLIARTSKHEKNTACLLIQLKDNLTCTCLI